MEWHLKLSSVRKRVNTIRNAAVHLQRKNKLGYNVKTLKIHKRFEFRACSACEGKSLHSNLLNASESATPGVVEADSDEVRMETDYLKKNRAARPKGFQYVDEDLFRT